jgi:hypothetical protein
MERKESGAYPYVFRDFHVTSINDYDIMHVAAAMICSHINSCSLPLLSCADVKWK